MRVVNKLYKKMYLVLLITCQVGGLWLSLNRLGISGVVKAPFTGQYSA